MTLETRVRRLVIPPVVCLAAGLLMLALDRLFPLPRLIAPAAASLGWLPAIAALGLAGWSLLTFRRARTTPHPWGEPRALVVSGPYRFTRNPMYLSLCLLLCGAWLSLGTAAALVGPLVFVVVIDRTFIRREEALLEQQFGEAFDAYRRRVRRWF